MVTPPYAAAPLRLLPFHGLSIAGSRVGEPATARAFARPYRKVTERLAQWAERGTLWRDPRPGLYLHEYTAGGITIRGLVGALDVTRRTGDPERAAVFPHEGIHPGQADELTRRMEQMQLNPAPILLVHRATDPLRTLLTGIRETSPVLDLRDRAGQQHRVWAVRRSDQLSAIARELGQAHALIADGHHRYGAYLRLQERAPGTAADRGLAMLVDQDDTPLFLGAIHRVLPGVSLDDLQVAAERTASALHRCDQEQAVAALGPGTMVATDGTAWATVRTPAARECTTVERLHERLLPALDTPPARIGHHHSVEAALAALTDRPATAVLLPAPEFPLVQRVVESGRLLPEKATSFQPKPSVGVLMRSLPDG